MIDANEARYSRRQLCLTGLLLGFATTPLTRRSATAFPLLTPLREIHVDSTEQLVEALGRAQPGDHIVLAGGTYPGGAVVSANGTASEPIVIRPAEPFAATLAGALELNGSWNVAHSLRFQGSDARAVVRGNDCRVLRCYFNGTRSEAIEIRDGAQRAELGYNEIRNYGAGAKFGRAIDIRLSDAGPAVKDPWIHHNHILDHLVDRGTSIGVGASAATSMQMVGALIEYNLIERSNSTTPLGCKASGCIFQFNTVRNSTNGTLQNRQGSYNKFIGNACINSGGVFVRGVGHEVIGNFKDDALTGNWWDHGAPTGTVSSIEGPTVRGTQWPIGESCLFVGNLPFVRIGGGSSKHLLPAVANRVEASDVVLVDGRNIDTTTASSTRIAVPPYVVLHPADVGPRAV